MYQNGKSFLCEKLEYKKLLIKYYPANGHSEYKITEEPNIHQRFIFTRSFEDLAAYFQNAQFKAELVYDKRLKINPEEQNKLEKIVMERNKLLEINPAKSQDNLVGYALDD